MVFVTLLVIVSFGKAFCIFSKTPLNHVIVGLHTRTYIGYIGYCTCHWLLIQWIPAWGLVGLGGDLGRGCRVKLWQPLPNEFTSLWL